MLPGHPIILLKSNSFNMAAISLKRSISTIFTNVVRSPHFIPIRKTRITRMIRILGTRMSWFKDD